MAGLEHKVADGQFGAVGISGGISGLPVFQTSLRNRIGCTGIGLHSGRPARMTLYPAPAGAGVLFRRTDLRGALSETEISVSASYDRVSGTQLGSTIANEAGVSISMVEHLMSALAGCGVDNVIVDLDGPEVPVLDGSSAPLAMLLECAGIAQLAARRRYIRILETVRIEDGEKSVSLSPHGGLRLNFEIDFASTAIGRQSYHFDLSPDAYKKQIACARTFGFLHEVEYLRSVGLALGGSLENAVVLDGDGVMNAGGLRFPDEFVRHKILDAIGDLYLAGAPVIGRFDGVRSGHDMNNRLLRKLFGRPEAFEFTDALAPVTRLDTVRKIRRAARA